MAWTTPRDWDVLEPLTASLLDEQLRDNLLETAPAKVQAVGDLVVGTGPNEIGRLASVGPGALVAHASGATPAWLTGTAERFLRINAAGNGVEWVSSPSGSELVSDGLTTGTSITFSSLSGRERYRLWVAIQGGAAGGAVRTMTVNGLSSGYRRVTQYDGGAATGATSQASWAILQTGSGAGVNETFECVTVELQLVEDHIVMNAVGNSSSTAPGYSTTHAGGSVPATSITSIVATWSYSAFATDPKARYALYRMGT